MASNGHSSKGMPLKVAAALVLIVVAAVLAASAWSASSDAITKQGAMTTRNSILNAAMQCCAIEGSYPLSLEYLEDNYGVHVNDDLYFVNYEAFASNVMPSVSVTVR